MTPTLEQHRTTPEPDGVGSLPERHWRFAGWLALAHVVLVSVASPSRTAPVSTRAWRASSAPNAEIAREIGVSLKTVQNDVSNVLAKIQVRDRTQAALRMRGLDQRP